MKTSTFNFSRVGLLFQRYFMERFHTELIYWSIMAIVFMFMRNNIASMSMLIFIAGIFYAGRFFKEIHFSGNGVAYFMIPATQLEKLTVGIIMTSFYYFAMMIIVYSIGNVFGTFLNNMLASMNFPLFFHHSSLQWRLFETYLTPVILGSKNITFVIFNLLLFNQSIYLLGSIYFKNNQPFKTFFAVNVIQILLLILVIIEIWIIDIPSINSISNIDYFSEWIIMGYRGLFLIVPLLLSAFFWVVSYFRLTEKQV